MTFEATSYDLAVIGSGGGAFAAAIRASSLGKRVVMIERDLVGGTCVNTGCVPSKALLAAAEARHVALDASRFPGSAATAGPVDMSALVAGKDALVGALRAEKYVDLAADYGWDLRRHRPGPGPAGDLTGGHGGDGPRGALPHCHRFHPVVPARRGPGGGRLPHLHHGHGSRPRARLAPGHRGRVRRPGAGPALCPPRGEGDHAGPLSPGLPRGARGLPDARRRLRR